MTSTPSISRLLMRAWAPVSFMISSSAGFAGTTTSRNASGTKNPSPAGEGRKSARARDGGRALHNYYENDGGGGRRHQNHPTTTPPAGEKQMRARPTGRYSRARLTLAGRRSPHEPVAAEHHGHAAEYPQQREQHHADPPPERRVDLGIRVDLER